MKQKEESTFCK